MYIDVPPGNCQIDLPDLGGQPASHLTPEACLATHEDLVAKTTLTARQTFPSDSDDYLQEARLGLLEAHAKFDSSKGASLRTYAYHRIRGRLTALNRDRRKHAMCRSLFEEVEVGSCGERELLINTLPGDYPPDDRELNIDVGVAVALLPGFLADLSENQSKAIRLIYWEGLTLSQTGERMGITRQRVHAITKKAIDFLRKKFSQN